MNRRGFLKMLGIGTVAAIAAPHITKFIESLPAPTIPNTIVCEGRAIPFSSMTSMFREYYSDARLKDLVYHDNPMLVLVRREK